MLLSKITDGQIVETKSLLDWGIFPNPPTAWHLETLGFQIVQSAKEHDSLTQKLVACDPVLESGIVCNVAVAELSAEEVVAAKAGAMTSVRATRNSRLSACDFTQVADYPGDKAAWATYRRALRDLPESGAIVDPRTFTDWPVAPGN